MNKHAVAFLDYVEKEGKGKYTVLSDYVKSAIKVKIKHDACGHIYEVTPNKFKSGRRCPKCAYVIRGKRKTQIAFEKHIKNLDEPDYEFIGEFKGMFKKMKVLHKKCGHVYEVLPSNFIHHGHRCPGEGCLRKRRSEWQVWTVEKFKRVVNDLVGDKYRVIGEYRNSSTPIEMEHKECGFVYSVTPGNFIHHEKRCPKCQYSRGEKRVEHFLQDKGLNFSPQHRFPDCKLELPLVFDFVVFDNKGDVTHAIEYDGEFHFYKKFRTDEEFALQKKRDEIKNEYCKSKGIVMIRIPYQQFNNIEKILTARLLKYDDHEPSALETV